MKATMFAVTSLLILASCKSTTGELKGTTFSSGQPVPGVRVNLIAQDKKMYTTITSADGSYRFASLPLGKYLFVTQYNEKPVTADVQLNELIKYNNQIKEFLGQTVSDDQVKQLKQESDRSIGLEAMRYYQEMQKSSNGMIASFAKSTGMEWDPIPEHTNKMIKVDTVELKGNLEKDIKL